MVLQYELIANHPYEHSQGDIPFTDFALRNHITKKSFVKKLEIFFFK